MERTDIIHPHSYVSKKRNPFYRFYPIHLIDFTFNFTVNSYLCYRSFFCRPCDRNVKDVELISGRLRRVEQLCRLPASVLQQLALCGYYEDLEKGVTCKCNYAILIIIIRKSKQNDGVVQVEERIDDRHAPKAFYYSKPCGI